MGTRAAIGWFVVVMAAVPSLLADGISPKSVDGKFPAPELKMIGSGSGAIVSSRHVLTNRHVVMTDKGAFREGFNILLPPDYKKRVGARVMFVDGVYDLAVLELAEPIAPPRFSILVSLPPLSTKVTACGFPTGSDFGVSLTVTGGQISRHPVSVAADDREDEAHIKRSLWHDAVITGGSSGGPLMTDEGVLVGLNSASLTADKDHALAVPGPIIWEFLNVCGVKTVATPVRTAAESKSRPLFQDVVAFVEILSSTPEKESSRRVEGTASGAAAARQQILDAVRAAIGELSRSQLYRLRPETLISIFPAKQAALLTSGQIMRVQAKLTLFQVLTDGALVELDGVRCFIVFPDGKGAELAAKIGRGTVVEVPHDEVYYVAEARPYETVSGRTSALIPLIPITALVTREELDSIIAEEKERRAKTATPKTESSDVGEKTLNFYLTKLRRTFSDASGNHSVDAAVVAVTADELQIVRLSDKTRVNVLLSKLSDDDRKWLQDNAAHIKTYGPRLAQLLEKQKQ
jgi:S1-C subfamily serine protease